MAKSNDGTAVKILPDAADAADRTGATGVADTAGTAAVPGPGLRDAGLHNIVKVLIIAGLWGFLFRNELHSIVGKWLTDASWSHGFLIPLFSLYFLNQRKGAILSAQARPNYAGLVLLIFILLFYFFNLVSPSGYAYFRSLSAIAAVGAVVLFLGGWRIFRLSFFAIAFLVFAVPLPRRYYVAMTMPMRRLAAGIATALLNLLHGMDATVNGVVIDIFYKGHHLEPSLNVAEACSGMRLLMAFLALGVMMAFLHYRPLWQRLILLAVTVPIAVLCNVIRVTATGFIYVLIHPKYTQGIYHDVLGMAMLPMAFGFYWFIAWFISSLIESDKPKEAVSEDVVYCRQDRTEKQ